MDVVFSWLRVVGCDVGVNWDVRPVALEDSLSVGVDFNKLGCLNAEGVSGKCC